MVVFAASNCLLLVLPWFRPKERKGDEGFPYYAYPATALAILGSGVVYWVWWAKIKPVVFGARGEGEGGYVRGHKSTLSDEVLPMLQYHSDIEGSARSSLRLVDEADDGHGVVEGEGGGVRKRAPCGCPLIHDPPPPPIEVRGLGRV